MAKEVIRLYHKDEFGNEYTQETVYEPFSEFGENAIGRLARLLPIFMRQMGYPMCGEAVMLEPLNEEEYDYLYEALEMYREQKSSTADEETLS